MSPHLVQEFKLYGALPYKIFHHSLHGSRSFLRAQTHLLLNCLYLVSFPPLLLRVNTRRLALNSITIPTVALVLQWGTKEHMSYCVISDELGLSALNVLPNVFCTIWGEPHSHRDLWKTCSTYLVTLFV